MYSRTVTCNTLHQLSFHCKSTERAKHQLFYEIRQNFQSDTEVSSTADVRVFKLNGYTRTLTAAIYLPLFMVQTEVAVCQSFLPLNVSLELCNSHVQVATLVRSGMTGNTDCQTKPSDSKWRKSNTPSHVVLLVHTLSLPDSPALLVDRHSLRYLEFLADW